MIAGGGTLWAVALKLGTEMAPVCFGEYQEQPLSSAVGITGWGKNHLPSRRGGIRKDSSSMWNPSRTVEHSRLLGGEKASLAASQSGNDFSRALKPVTS